MDKLVVRDDIDRIMEHFLGIKKDILSYSTPSRIDIYDVTRAFDETFSKILNTEYVVEKHSEFLVLRGYEINYEVSDRYLDFYTAIEIGMDYINNVVREFIGVELIELKSAVILKHYVEVIISPYKFLTKDQKDYLEKEIPIVDNIVELLTKLSYGEDSNISDVLVVNDLGLDVIKDSIKELGYEYEITGIPDSSVNKNLKEIRIEITYK